MSHSSKLPAKAQFYLALSYEQVNHIAISLASDIGSAESLMPEDFLLCHHELLKMFMELLANQEQMKIMRSVSSVRIRQ